jgi:DNA processing protein
MWKESLPISPNGLWIEGKESLLDSESICIAGSREPLRKEALDEAFELGKKIATLKSCSLVSGLARGIDIMSLRGFYTGKREIGAEFTAPFLIGCIGTSPDSVYPRENDRLQTLLKQEHLLLSLVQPEQRTNKFHFLERNRLMARLSSKIYIMSCTETSGCHTLLDEGLLLKKQIYMSEDNVNLTWVRRIVVRHEKSQGDLNFRVLSNKQMIDIQEERNGR